MLVEFSTDHVLSVMLGYQPIETMSTFRERDFLRVHGHGVWSLNNRQSISLRPGRTDQVVLSCYETIYKERSNTCPRLAGTKGRPSR